MRAEVKDELVRLGAVLRELIKKNHASTGRPYRHLSRSIGKDANYITSYLGKSPDDWTIPKHPAYGKLLAELDVTEEELLRLAAPASDATAATSDVVAK